MKSSSTTWTCNNHLFIAMTVCVSRTSWYTVVKHRRLTQRHIRTLMLCCRTTSHLTPTSSPLTGQLTHFNTVFGFEAHGVTSVLWCCWLSGRKSIRPVRKLDWWGAGVVICLERSANDLQSGSADATATQSSLFQQNPEWFILLVLAYPGGRGQRATKQL